MTKVFISYSRKDKAQAQKLTEALNQSDLETWVDWQDIPPTADWMEQIHTGIEQADAFLFLLSPDSVQSEVCGKEVEHAAANGKRLVPIVAREVNPKEVHPALAKVNWIYFREQDNFESAIAKTLSAIRTDLAWVETHKRLQVRAIEWNKRKDGSLLLRGKDLREAEETLASVGQKDPQPTDLQRTYLLASRRAEIRTRNVLLAIGAVVMVALVLLSAFAVNQRNTATDNASTAIANQNLAQTAQANAEFSKATAVGEANIRATAQAVAEIERQNALEKAKIARAGELASQASNVREKNFVTSLLLGIEAFQTKDIYQSYGVLLDNTQSNPALHKFLSGHTDDVKSVTFSPDGKILASGGEDDSIILWDMATGQPIGQPLRIDVESTMRDVTSLAFSPDGKTLASGSITRDITLWNIATGQPIAQPLTGHTDRVNSVAFSPDGKILAAGSSDNTIILWDAATGQPIGQPLIGHTDSIYTIAFSPDGKVLASGSYGGTVILWDVSVQSNTYETKVRPIGKLPIGVTSSIYSIAFNPNGQTLVTSAGNTIALWDVATRKSIGQLGSDHYGQITSVAFSPDGKILASGSCGKFVSGTVGIQGEIILWDLATSQPIGQPLLVHAGYVNSLAFSPDGKTLASGSDDQAVILWDISDVFGNNMAPRRSIIGQSLSITGSSIRGMVFNPDGKILASIGYKVIDLWDVATIQPIGQPLEGLSWWAKSLAFSPDGKTLAAGGCGSDDYMNCTQGEILLWDMTSHQPIGEPLKGHTKETFSLAFSPDGKTFVSGSSGCEVTPLGKCTIGEIIVWDVATRQPTGPSLAIQIPYQVSIVTSLAFSPHEKILASGTLGGSIVLWDMAKAQPIGQPLSRHTRSINSVAFSPDGKILASGSGDNTIILWDVATGQPIGLPLARHAGSVNSVVFSPDGQLLASGSDDFSIILWDVTTGQPIGQPFTGLATSLAFSPDGKMLVTGGGETIMLWDLNPQSWIEKTCQRANRNFTRAEWAQYFPGEEYRATCPQWPLEPEPTATSTP